MNKIFKVIFSKAKGIFVVTGENAKAQGKSKHLKAIAASVMIASALGMAENAEAAIANTQDSIKTNYYDVDNRTSYTAEDSQRGPLISAEGQTLTFTTSTIKGEGVSSTYEMSLPNKSSISMIRATKGGSLIISGFNDLTFNKGRSYDGIFNASSLKSRFLYLGFSPYLCVCPMNTTFSFY